MTSADNRITDLEKEVDELKTKLDEVSKFTSLPKGVLYFDLSDGFGKQDFIRAQKATDAYLVLWDMMNEFRNVYKYGQDFVAADFAEKWRDKLIEVMQGHSIDLDNELS